MHDDDEVRDAVTAADLNAAIGLLLLIQERMERVRELMETAVEEIRALGEGRG
jgi:hypothetical protein